MDEYHFQLIVHILCIYSVYDCFVLFVLQYNLGLLAAWDAELPQYDVSTAALEVHFITARFSNLGCVII
jgi:hypothetical protein